MSQPARKENVARIRDISKEPRVKPKSARGQPRHTPLLLSQLTLSTRCGLMFEKNLCGQWIGRMAGGL
jgi:hypothetical protein